MLDTLLGAWEHSLERFFAFMSQVKVTSHFVDTTPPPQERKMKPSFGAVLS